MTDSSLTFSETIYLTVIPVYPSWSMKPNGIRVSRMLKSKPESLTNGEIVVKLKVTVPRETFEQVIPVAEVVLPVPDPVDLTVDAEYAEVSNDA